MMLSKIQAGRAAGLAGLGVLAFTLAPVPGAVAQEKEEERPSWRFGVDLVGSGTQPMLGVLLRRDENDENRVVVADVLRDSPAERAGIIDGDVILSVNGHDLSEPLEGEDEEDPDLPEERVRALVIEASDGEGVTLEIDRDGERLTFVVVPEIMPRYSLGPSVEALRDLSEWWSDESTRQETLERIRELAEGFRDQYRTLERDTARWSLPGNLRFRGDTRPSRGLEVFWDGTRFGGRGTHGLDLVELNPGLGAYFGTEEGVLIADVEDDASLGLQPGDVVVAVDGRVVDDIDELRRILRSYEDDEEIAFRIFRDGAQTTVTGTIN
ncbi:MAG: PDZ domain-containing protein [Gemmatimonadota bacterium]|nr:PDZ domain-containing protein [Gemmatimonadota bacterium]